MNIILTMVRKYSFLLFLLLSSTAFLLYCSGPTEPELDNPYDQESGSYVPTPDLNTAPVTPLATAAITGGVFETDFGLPVTQKGVCWSSSETPTIEDNCTNDGDGNTSFETLIDSLELENPYYVRAYAFHEEGVLYGGQRSFTTRDGIPDLITTVANEIEAFSALTGGEITDNGGAEITERGICYSTTENPTLEDSCVASGEGEGSFTVSLDELTPDTPYFARAYSESAASVGYGNQIEFRTRDGVPSLTTTEPFDIGRTSARTGGTITDDGGADITETGVCYMQGNGTPDHSDMCITGTLDSNTFEVILEDLIQGETYNVRAYATNELATAWGGSYEFQITDVINPATGQTWMDRNLGASRAATSSTDSEAYCDLYQWGREADGHQKRNSSTTTTLSSSDQPSHGDFILSTSEANWDWRSPQNDNLWQGVNGINNPCPAGYRLPTDAEWNAERNSWSNNNASGAINSPLKLPMAGRRSSSSGLLLFVGSHGRYWSGTVSGSSARYLGIISSEAALFSDGRASGFSVRCLED
jgi:uncharacterized protein (TIGR02145 family)